ncbi:MAG: hypothetical protein E7048_04035 [Lentisphaerae bacterium]|nr:hypothetical protein [Lentisphaerota bacterium]
MIVSMKKVLLLALESDARNALEELRNAGVMQINQAAQVSNDTLLISENRNRAERILSELEKYEVAPAEKCSLSGTEILERAAAAIERRNSADGEAEKLRRRLVRLEPWGDFKRDDIAALEAQGVYVTLCEGDDETFEAAQKLEGFCCREISNVGHVHYFVLMGTKKADGERFSGIVLADDDDPRMLKEQIAAINAREDAAVRELEELARYADVLKKEMAVFNASLEFQQAVDALTAAGTVVYLSGYVPEPDVDVLRESARKNGWGLVIDDPAEDETVPVLLKDNKFTRIIKPLFDFLGVLPGYREMDVAGGVLIFFTIFYAMIIGDAGYGMIFLLLALAARWKFKDKPALKLPLGLLILLSSATVVWGALSGSWFGIPGIPGIKWLTDPATKDQNIQFFCFLLAFAQLALGRVWRAIHEGGIRSYIRHIGWALIVFGNFILTLKIIVWQGAFPVWMYWVYGAGLLMVMAADVNWKDPADCFQFPFNVIGSFTDVLSYIRLFAVGMAGGCIASSFNNMGLDVFKASCWFIPFGILAILCGHLLNIALGFMSVLVHGVRLNTLEFSNHTGLSWSGQKFKPFKKNNMEE